MNLLTEALHRDWLNNPTGPNPQELAHEIEALHSHPTFAQARNLEGKIIGFAIGNMPAGLKNNSNDVNELLLEIVNDLSYEVFIPPDGESNFYIASEDRNFVRFDKSNYELDVRASGATLTLEARCQQAIFRATKDLTYLKRPLFQAPPIDGKEIQLNSTQRDKLFTAIEKTYNERTQKEPNFRENISLNAYEKDQEIVVFANWPPNLFIIGDQNICSLQQTTRCLEHNPLITLPIPDQEWQRIVKEETINWRSLSNESKNLKIGTTIGAHHIATDMIDDILGILNKPPTGKPHPLSVWIAKMGFSSKNNFSTLLSGTTETFSWGQSKQWEKEKHIFTFTEVVFKDKPDIILGEIEFEGYLEGFQLDRDDERALGIIAEEYLNEEEDLDEKTSGCPPLCNNSLLPGECEDQLLDMTCEKCNELAGWGKRERTFTLSLDWNSNYYSTTSLPPFSNSFPKKKNNEPLDGLYPEDHFFNSLEWLFGATNSK